MQMQILNFSKPLPTSWASRVMGNGIWALLKAPSMLYCTPRIILCPGYTGQLANSLDTLRTGVAGKGYIPGAEYTVNFVQGGGETNGAQLVLPAAHAVADAKGEIHDLELFIDGFGAWMTVAPTATLPAPDGDPITAQPAMGAITFSQAPGIGSGILFNGLANVVFVSGAPTGLQVQLAPNDLQTTLDRLLTFLQASVNAEIAKNTYSMQGGTLIMVSKTNGIAGNCLPDQHHGVRRHDLGHAPRRRRCCVCAGAVHADHPPLRSAPTRSARCCPACSTVSSATPLSRAQAPARSLTRTGARP